MANISMKLLLEAGVHFGHQTNKWNPKMKPFIFGARNGIYIIDLQQTVVLFQTAYNFVVEMVAAGGELLFVGTKKAVTGIDPGRIGTVRHALCESAVAGRNDYKFQHNQKEYRPAQYPG